MSTETDKIMADMQLDVDKLYLEETFTDLRVGSLRRMTPVKKDGTPDATRSVLFSGQTQLLSQVGPLPVSAEIRASSLEDALAKFPAAMKEAIERMIDEVKEMQREQASQIVVPDGNPGGKIQLR